MKKVLFALVAVSLTGLASVGCSSEVVDEETGKDEAALLPVDYEPGEYDPPPNVAPGCGGEGQRACKVKTKIGSSAMVCDTGLCVRCNAFGNCYCSVYYC